MTKIMIVDDESDLRNMLNLILLKKGFETDLAEDGVEFLDKIDNSNPDVVILDVMMPGPTMVEILEKLKKKKCKPKIILLTVVRYSEKEKEKMSRRLILLTVNQNNRPFLFRSL